MCLVVIDPPIASSVNVRYLNLVITYAGPITPFKVSGDLDKSRDTSRVK